MRENLNYTLSVFCDPILEQADPLIIKITVQSTIFENFKGWEI